MVSDLGASNCGFCGANSGWLDEAGRAAWRKQHDIKCPSEYGRRFRSLSNDEKRAILPRCIYCDRSSLDVRHNGMGIGGAVNGRSVSGICCNDCDARIRAGAS